MRRNPVPENHPRAGPNLHAGIQKNSKPLLGVASRIHINRTAVPTLAIIRNHSSLFRILCGGNHAIDCRSGL